jgi:hypothetical protein
MSSRVIDVRRIGARWIVPKRGQKVESNGPSRAADSPGGETQRGQQHVGKAGKREGM